MNEPEWQLHDTNEWMFGVKVRGVIRKRLAEIYFNEDIKRDGDPEYGWVWMVHNYPLPNDKPMVRGVAHNLNEAIRCCEQELGILDE